MLCNTQQNEKDRNDEYTPEYHVDSSERKHLALNFTSFLQLLMKDSGFHSNDTKHDNPSFSRFRTLALLDASHHMICIKSNQSQNIVDEQRVFKEILVKFDFYFEAEPKMMCALERFRNKLSGHVQNRMLGAGFQLSDTEPHCVIFVDFLKDYIISENEKTVSLRQDHATFEEETNDFTTCSQVTSDANTHENAESKVIEKIAIENLMRDSTFYLLKKTEKHIIYSIAPEYMVLKLLRSSCHLPEDIQKLDHELETAKSCFHPSIRNALARITYHGQQGLLMEMVEGYTLNDLVERKPTEIKYFLKIAREIIYALLAMHSSGVAHTNMNCEHIILNPQSDSLTIIGIGSSINFNNHGTNFFNQALLDRDLHYISPEQTGRIDRVVDFRSDFYSLGVIFYKLLTGIYPIESDNALEIINLHITHTPIPANDINPGIPIPISNMISKLLEKDPENRYKSTKGIMFDLESMMSDFSTDRQISSFTLAQHDTSQSFFVSQKFRGRSKEYKNLCDIFDNFSRDTLEIVFVAGNSGVGKSLNLCEFRRIYI